MHFQKNQFFSSNLLLVGFDLAVLCMCFLGHFFSSAIIKLRIASCLQICIGSHLACHQIIWYNKRIHSHDLKISSCCFFFSLSEETKFEKIITEILLISSILNYASKRPHDKIKFSSKFPSWKTLE